MIIILYANEPIIFLINPLDTVIIKNTNGKTHLYSLSVSKFSNKLFDLSVKTIYPPIYNQTVSY